MTLPGFLCVNTRCALRPARHGLHARTHIIWLFWLLWLGCLVMSKPHCRVASFNFMGILLFSFSYCFIHLFFTLAALRVLGNMYLCCRLVIASALSRLFLRKRQRKVLHYTAYRCVGFKYCRLMCFAMLCRLFSF